MAEKRIDPIDGTSYTYEDLAVWYKGKFKKKVIDEYWNHTCYAQKGANKAKQKAVANEAGGHEETETRKGKPPRLKPELRRRKTLTFKHIFTKINPGKLDDFYDVGHEAWGEGAFGQVVRGVNKETKQERAIKVMDQSKIIDKKRFEAEIRIQQELDHINIVKLCETFKDARAIYLVMELCTGGMLFDWLEEAEFFCEKDAASYMRQLLSAVNYLHSSHFVHRDIKPENILLLSEDEGAPIKLIDFGAARGYTPGSGPTMMTKIGTVTYLSPQVFKMQGYDEKCDTWACGVLTYHMLSGDLPFSASTDGEIARKVKEGKFDFPSSSFEGVSEGAKEIITQMLSYDPAARPSVADLLKNKWLDENAPMPTVCIAKDLGARMKSFKAASKLKRVALTVIAKQLKNQDLEDLKSTFEVLDVNKNGTVSPAEMRQMMEKHAIDIPADLDLLLSSCDSDGSGAIDYTEFVAATVQTKFYKRRSVMWAAFRTFDTDGDGVISKSDLASLLQESDGSTTVADVFSEATKGDSEQITFEQFESIITDKLEDGSDSSRSSQPGDIKLVTDTSNPISKRKSVVFC